MKATIAVIHGDGIGPEIVPQGTAALTAVAERFGHAFTLRPVAMGYNAWKATGSALSAESIAVCAASDGVLLGATGAADWEYTRKDAPPGWGRRQLCRELRHQVSIRPVKIFPQTLDVSPIKRERLEGADLVIVRDMTLVNKAGLAHNEDTPRGRLAWDRLEFYEDDVRLSLKFALLLARSRRRKLCLMSQTSIFATARLWMSVLGEMSAEYPDVAIEVQAPDNFAMQFVRNPTVFDVVVADSTAMGGMMNNIAAMMMGSIGMAPGTSTALRDGDTFSGMVERTGIYEPIHGSAPVRAGQGIVNPIGTVLAAAMLLRYSLGLEAEARAIEAAVEAALDKGYRTYDIMQPGMTQVGTAEMGARIVDEIRRAGAV